VRSILAAIAAAWFAYFAFTFMPQGVYANDGSLTGIDGDPSAVAVTWAARVLFAGLTFIALALIDWGRIWRALTSLPEDDLKPPH